MISGLSRLGKMTYHSQTKEVDRRTHLDKSQDCSIFSQITISGICGFNLVHDLAKGCTNATI